MSLLRNCGTHVRPMCNLFKAPSLTARICTTVTVQKSGSSEGQPYPFMSKYKADEYRVEDTFKSNINYGSKYEPYIIFSCFGIFILYFGCLREEHDVDIAISKHLYEVMPGLEEQDLRRTIKKEKKHGRDTSAYEARLNELLAEKSKKVSSSGSS